MLTALRVGLATLALAAIGQQLVIHIGASYSVLNFFSYFTNLSNLFAAVVLLLSVFSPPFQRGGAGDVVRYLSTVNMAVVGLVFAVLLRDVDLGALLPWVNFVLHYVMPVAIVLDWLLKPPTGKLQAQHLALALVFPVVYLVCRSARRQCGLVSVSVSQPRACGRLWRRCGVWAGYRRHLSAGVLGVAGGG